MILDEVILFKGVSHSAMKDLADISSEKTYPRGTVLFEKGEKAGTLFILQQGTIDLVIKNGGRITNRLNAPGEVFGWSSMVEDGHYTASCICATDIRAYTIEKSKMDAFFHRHPETGLKILKRLAAVISSRLSATYSELLDVRGEGPLTEGYKNQ